MIFDFDQIDEWAPALRTELGALVSPKIASIVAKSEPEFTDDAADTLLNATDGLAVVDRISSWIREQTIVAYHGSRLTAIELASIRENGLLPLAWESRAERIRRALSFHPKWSDVEPGLEDALIRFGERHAGGHRSGQVHLTVSRAGLINSFNHYLTYGSEFDQRVAQYLLGDEGMSLLANDGVPTVIQVHVPGVTGLAACNRFMTNPGRAGLNLVKEILQAWSYKLAYPNWQSKSLKEDCGMILYEAIPAYWIKSAETVTIPLQHATTTP